MYVHTVFLYSLNDRFCFIKRYLLYFVTSFIALNNNFNYHFRIILIKLCNKNVDNKHFHDKNANFHHQIDNKVDINIYQ